MNIYKLIAILLPITCLTSYDLFGWLGVLAVILPLSFFTVGWILQNVSDGMRWNYGM